MIRFWGIRTFLAVQSWSFIIFLYSTIKQRIKISNEQIGSHQKSRASTKILQVPFILSICIPIIYYYKFIPATTKSENCINHIQLFAQTKENEKWFISYIPKHHLTHFIFISCSPVSTKQNLHNLKEIIIIKPPT